MPSIWRFMGPSTIVPHLRPRRMLRQFRSFGPAPCAAKTPLSPHFEDGTHPQLGSPLIAHPPFPNRPAGEFTCPRMPPGSISRHAHGGPGGTQFQQKSSPDPSRFSADQVFRDAGEWNSEPQPASPRGPGMPPVGIRSASRRSAPGVIPWPFPHSERKPAASDRRATATAQRPRAWWEKAIPPPSLFAVFQTAQK